MPLHDRESVRSSLDDSVYASRDLGKAAPKYRFPNDEWRSDDAYALVADELMLDGNSRQNWRRSARRGRNRRSIG